VVVRSWKWKEDWELMWRGLFKDQTVAVAPCGGEVGQWVGQAGTHAAFVIPARRHGFRQRLCFTQFCSSAYRRTSTSLTGT